MLLSRLSPPSSLQLSVKVVNVPSLSAGVMCVFEELTESPGEVLAKGQILCMSPSLRDVPSLAQGYGKASIRYYYTSIVIILII
jgi:hypothetical protein